MSHELHLWTDERKVGVIAHDAKDDCWSIAYDKAWVADPDSFPLSPALPLVRPEAGYSSNALKRFIEHLLPEGRALDVAVAYNGLAKSNVFGLIRALGAETAGALRFTTDAVDSASDDDPAPREITLQELDDRIARHEQLPLTVWDGKVRMSLARRMGLPAAEVSLLRTPRPVLVVRRFDREVEACAHQVRVRRRHIIDTCQACDLPVSYKYERNLGSAPAVRHIRDGVSFERLFHCAELTSNKAAARLTLLRWALFQFLVGNSDAHGKNFSFLVRPGGLLEPTEWYDLVSVLQYDGFDTELAMAYGDVFVHEEVSAFALADFATRCGIDRKLMRREGQRLARLAIQEAALQAESGLYLADERSFIQGIAHFVTRQALQLSKLVSDASAIKADYL